MTNRQLPWLLDITFTDKAKCLAQGVAHAKLEYAVVDVSHSLELADAGETMVVTQVQPHLADVVGDSYGEAYVEILINGTTGGVTHPLIGKELVVGLFFAESRASLNTHFDRQTFLNRQIQHDGYIDRIESYTVVLLEVYVLILIAL